MDKLDRLKTDRVKTGPNTTRPVHPAVVAALERGKTLMNKYYELTDLSNIYHIAMGKILLLVIFEGYLSIY